MNCLKKCLLLILLLTSGLKLFAQTHFFINGNAFENNCNCYTLTSTDYPFQTGSVWNKNKINLENAFSYQFKFFMGCDSSGADGLTFVLQPDSTALGNVGAGMGFQGIDSSLGVVIDAYQNDEQNDPPYDHITIMSNGDTYHNSADNLAGPVMALNNSQNIKDCKWHLLKVDWQPGDSTFNVSVDGVLRLTLQKDIIHSIFNNQPIVYWGFTAGTGYFVNVQEICTFNVASFQDSPQTAACANATFSFTDSSTSFGNLTNWYWDFGDSSTSTQQNTQHVFSSPGIYKVTLNVMGNDGCLSDTASEEITVNENPQANFTDTMDAYCSGDNVTFIDSSVFNNITPASWYWNFGNGDTSVSQDPSTVYYTPGIYDVQLKVENMYGCADSAEKQINISKTSLPDFVSSNGCKNTSISFNVQPSATTNSIKAWNWNFDDGSSSQGATISHTFQQAGIYNVQLYGVMDDGCVTDTATKSIKIYEASANAGNDTTIIIGSPYQIQASGGESYTWSPSEGLSNSFIADPVATLFNDMTYYLTVSGENGCSAKDTLHLKVEKGPEIYGPSAFTPNGDGKNDRYKIFPVGIAELIAFRIFNRWGQVLYSSLNTNEGWSGSANGVPQPAGTYIWMAAGKTIDGQVLKKQGTLVLIR